MSRASLPPLEDDFSRALLGSAEADAPSHAAYTKAAAALGIGVGLGVGASLPAPAAVAAGAAGMAGLARGWSSWGAKLLAVGVSGGLLVGSGALLLRSSPPAPQAGIQSPLAPKTHAAEATIEAARVASSPSSNNDRHLPSSSSPPVATSAEPPSAAGRALVLAPPRRRAGRALPARALSTRASTGSSLAEQVQSLDRARVALGSGDASSALREIAHYRAAWPGGVFLTEASVLEIEALAARGERSLAATRAADFVADHPDSPQADRLRALIPAKKR